MSTSRTSSFLRTTTRSHLPLRHSRRASSSSSSSFPSSSSGGAAATLPPRTSRSSPDDLYDIRQIQPFQFDDTTSVGHLWLEKRRERSGLLRAIEQDRAVLEQQRKPFTPPSTSQILRYSSIIHLTTPPSSPHPLDSKRVLTVPIRSLPLTSPQAVHRFKLLAGPRWSVVDRTETFKMAEESFKDGKANRRWLDDVITKLVEESNNPTTPTLQFPLLPIDTRHLIARHQKKKHGRPAPRAKVVGGVKGFPEAWL